MSNWKKNGPSGPIPPRWLYCPRKAIKLIQNKFLAFKTPLSSDFDRQVPEECRFTIDMLFASLKTQKIKLGLWIDLTNTSRFYDKRSLEQYGCKYLKLECRGHGETPSEEQTRTFVQLCRNFIMYNPLEIIGVHCTHGFNRTGFLIISYLVETDSTSVDAGLVEFATARPPGIYKGDYIQELFRRYDDVKDAPEPPQRPAWCLEYDDSNVDDRDAGPSRENNHDMHNRRRRREIIKKTPIFMAGIPGVTAVSDKEKLQKIQQRVQAICHWKTGGFPGSQPVSMSHHNIVLLHEIPYMVSWKADGTRYMMYIQENGEVYFLDRDNSVFQVSKLTFPHPKDKTKILGETLLDGEMVIDKDVKDNREYPRYLVYDIIMYDTKDVSSEPFHPKRYSMIEEIMNARRRLQDKDRRAEPFAVRRKAFWDVTQAEALLDKKFIDQLSHKADGLMFQPATEPYCTGVSQKVLKWKPESMNSVDFKLKIVVESGEGKLKEKLGQLFVGGLDVPFGLIKFTKEMKNLDGAIIECKFEYGRWVFMRERTDKSFPNSLSTAQSVCETIAKPITKERLLYYIKRRQLKI